jgi:hypothetical protein
MPPGDLAVLSVNREHAQAVLPGMLSSRRNGFTLVRVSLNRPVLPSSQAPFASDST